MPILLASSGGNVARKPRIHFPNAFYHVILRGNGKQDIFFDDQDRYRFYLLLQEGVERFRHRIYAFCLMTNHIHLVLQVQDIPLSRIMQNLAFRYTRWVNWRHGRSGHLFQGRYKAVLVDGDAYLLELVRYVHLNPVRAGMAETAAEYSWSGHRAYIGKDVVPWLCAAPTLEMFSTRMAAAIEGYALFVSDGATDGRRPDFHGEGIGDSRVLGDEGFVEAVTGPGCNAVNKISVDDVVAAVCGYYGTKPEMLAQSGKGRALSRARGMAAWIVQEMPSCSLTELGHMTGRDISSLSAVARRMQLRAGVDDALCQERDEVLRQMSICKA